MQITGECEAIDSRLRRDQFMRKRQKNMRVLGKVGLGRQFVVIFIN